MPFHDACQLSQNSMAMVSTSSPNLRLISDDTETGRRGEICVRKGADWPAVAKPASVRVVPDFSSFLSLRMDHGFVGAIGERMDWHEAAVQGY